MIKIFAVILKKMNFWYTFAVCREKVSDDDGHVILSDHLVQKQIVAIPNGAFSNPSRLLYL